MSGAEVVAVISVSIAGLTSLMATCFHSRCSDIDCWGIKCKREVMKEPQEVIARPIV
jgi:hypothetical protein